ncbi:MAG: TetR/AcrR family transcriptional regulator [Desulfobacter sp.]
MNKWEKNKQAKQAAILSSALTIFSEKGYTAAKIADIARAAGVGKGTIYEYYRNKEALFFAVFQWYTDFLAGNSMVDAASLGGNAARRLNALMRSTFMAVYDQLDTFSVFLEFWAAAGNPAIRERYRVSMLNMYEKLTTLIAGLVEEGKRSRVFHPDLDVHATAMGLVSSLDGLMLQAWMDRTFDAPTAANRFFDTVIRGMRAK